MNVYLAVGEYVFAWKMASVMLYIKDQMESMYSEIDILSRYMNVKVNCFNSRVDTATKNVPYMSDVA